MDLPSTHSSPLIEFKDVTIGDARTPGRVVLEKVKWAVNAGEFWAVAGIQGSGKSGLLATAAGLNPPIHGEVQLFGNNLQQAKGDDLVSLRRRVGLVFEGGGRLFQQMTVGENVALPLQYHFNWSLDQASAETLRTLEVVEATHLMDVRAARLGRAWAQRVALARALVLRPELLLLDNPLGGADSVHIRWWRSFLSSIAAGHPFWAGRCLTIILACEDLRPLIEIATQFAVAHQRHFEIVGGRDKVAQKDHEFLNELMEEY